MTTAITVTSSPPYKVTGPLRNLRHASPAVAVTFCPGKRAGGCTSTSVSRPLMVVKFFSPAFTSRQTGALLPGCSAWRCCCCWASDWAHAAPANCIASARRKTLIVGTLLVDAYVFVLAELARLDLVFPARAVALRPLAAAVGERRVVPGLRVGLALVLAFLEVGDLLALGTGRKPEQGNQEQDPDHDLPRAGCCAGGCAPGLPGP